MYGMGALVDTAPPTIELTAEPRAEAVRSRRGFRTAVAGSSLELRPLASHTLVRKRPLPMTPPEASRLPERARIGIG